MTLRAPSADPANRVQVNIDWDRDGEVDESGWLENGRLTSDSGRTSDSWEWDNDAMTNWWDFNNPIDDSNSAINQAIAEWNEAFSATGNVGTAAGRTASDAPEVLGNAFDAFWRWAWDGLANSLTDSYDVWDVYPEGQVPQAPADGSSPAVNNYESIWE